MCAMPAITKTYTHVTNQRITYVSIIDAASKLLFNIFSAQLVTAGGFTCVGSSTGVTATGAIDGVNRWASAANCGVRGANTTAIQSWLIFRCGNGWDWLVTFQGSADNNVKLSVSPGQLWTINGTNAAFQPTAADEIPVASNAFNFADSNASLDRLWNVSWSSDKKIWRTWVLRNSGMTSFLAGEEITSTVTAISGPTVIGVASTANGFGGVGHNGTGGCTGGGAINNGAATRFATTNVVLSGSSEAFAGSSGPAVFGIEKPELHAASPVLPVGVCNITTASFKGKVGNRIDVWAGFTNAITDQSGDVYAGATYTGFGCVGVFPFDGSSKVIA